MPDTKESSPEAEFTHEHEATFGPDVHRAWSDGGREPVVTVGFDFNAVDEALGVIHAARPQVREEAAEVLRQLMAWCFRKDNLRQALVKFTAITAGLRPELLGNRTLRELALECGCTKQNLSKSGLRFADAFGIQFSRGRLPSARKLMANARRGGPDRHHGKQSQST